MPTTGLQRAIAAGSLVLLFASGCATYSEDLASVRFDVDRGAYPAALDQLNDMLGVESIEEFPESWGGDRALAALERSVLLQAEGEFALSARDLSGAETELELLDLSTDTAGQIGKYVYSGSSKHYEASATERVALNGLNIANYLALGDLEGSAIEARRYTNMRDYLESIDLEAIGRFGAYLAGFAFERLGEGDRALRYYEEALEGGPLDSLAGPVARLARQNPYRGPGIDALLEGAGQRAGVPRPRPAEILTVVARGRVPYKAPERIPIGAAVGFAGAFITGNTAILERSLFKVVVYPELVRSGSRAGKASVSIDGGPAQIERVSDLGADITREYELIKPRIIGAAITRMIARALAAEGARAAGRQAGGAGEVVGLLAALATEGTLVALDKPDTRSWTFLPDQIDIARSPVSSGTHDVQVVVDGVGETHSFTVDVPKSGYAVVVVTVPR